MGNIDLDFCMNFQDEKKAAEMLDLLTERVRICGHITVSEYYNVIFQDDSVTSTSIAEDNFWKDMGWVEEDSFEVRSIFSTDPPSSTFRLIAVKNPINIPLFLDEEVICKKLFEVQLAANDALAILKNMCKQKGCLSLYDYSMFLGLPVYNPINKYYGWEKLDAFGVSYKSETRLYELRPSLPCKLHDIVTKVQTFDNVSNPSHYCDGRIYEPRKVIADWGLNFNLGNTVKYISRAGRKGDKLEDLRKAAQYLQWEIEQLEEDSREKQTP